MNPLPTKLLGLATALFGCVGLMNAASVTLIIRESGWFLLRTIAGVTNTFRFASTAPWYVEVDGKPMQPRRESAQFFVDWSRERLAKLETLTGITAAQQEALLQPWREAETFWRDKLAAAVVLSQPPLKNESENQ